jgi:hypothetical protein
VLEAATDIAVGVVLAMLLIRLVQKYVWRWSKFRVYLELALLRSLASNVEANGLSWAQSIFFFLASKLINVFALAFNFGVT